MKGIITSKQLIWEILISPNPLNGKKVEDVVRDYGGNIYLNLISASPKMILQSPLIVIKSCSNISLIA